MQYFDRIDLSQGIHVNKTSELKEDDICHYWYFLDEGFKFQPNVCSGCHDLLMMSMNLSNIAILNIKGSDYLCIIIGVSKNEATNLMQNTKSVRKKWDIIKHKVLLSHIKLDKEVLKLGEVEI